MGLLEQVLVTWDGAVALVTDTETDSVLYFVYLYDFILDYICLVAIV